MLFFCGDEFFFPFRIFFFLIANANKKIEEKIMSLYTWNVDSGINNEGNSCYISSVLQLLRHLKISKNLYGNVSHLVRKLRFDFNQFLNVSTDSVRQEDAAEFLQFILERYVPQDLLLTEGDRGTIEGYIEGGKVVHWGLVSRNLMACRNEGGNVDNNVAEYITNNSVDKLDGLEVPLLRSVSSIGCTIFDSGALCETVLNPVRWLVFTVDVPEQHGLLKCSELLQHPSQCESCGNGDCSTLREMTCDGPLLLQFKRFGKNNNGEYTKLQNSIECDDLVVQTAKNKPRTLKATGYILHLGGTLNGGHYVSVILSKGKWFMCNDSTVTEHSLGPPLEVAIVVYQEMAGNLPAFGVMQEPVINVALPLATPSPAAQSPKTPPPDAQSPVPPNAPTSKTVDELLQLLQQESAATFRIESDLHRMDSESLQQAAKTVLTALGSSSNLENWKQFNVSKAMNTSEQPHFYDMVILPTTISELLTNGWSVTLWSNVLKEKVLSWPSNEAQFVTIFGNFNTGKSFFLTKLFNKTAAIHGNNIHTEGISIAITEKYDYGSTKKLIDGPGSRVLAVLDTAGRNSPSCHPRGIDGLQTALSDTQFMSEFIKDVAVHLGGAFVLVVSQLSTRTEREIAQVVECVTDRRAINQEIQKEKVKSGQEPMVRVIIVLHNLKDLELEHVATYAERVQKTFGGTLRKSAVIQTGDAHCVYLELGHTPNGIELFHFFMSNDTKKNVNNIVVLQIRGLFTKYLTLSPISSSTEEGVLLEPLWRQMERSLSRFVQFKNTKSFEVQLDLPLGQQTPDVRKGRMTCKSGGDGLVVDAKKSFRLEVYDGHPPDATRVNSVQGRFKKCRIQFCQFELPYAIDDAEIGKMKKELKECAITAPTGFAVVAQQVVALQHFLPCCVVKKFEEKYKIFLGPLEPLEVERLVGNTSMVSGGMTQQIQFALGPEADFQGPYNIIKNGFVEVCAVNCWAEQGILVILLVFPR